MARRYKLARGVCPMCSGDYSLRKNGTMRKHGPCDGWGYDPLRITKQHGWRAPHVRRSPPLVPVT